ncbi:hypothetical protein FIBSPDRAFT_890926 [Athelia psychrophila]|uniref:Uncharacterized protein n=1 Tax=Athelia psychrophila TaxID=1759441 RepID=A0A166KA60_9AGAM|nr:hypothetical protein FIBSPDRAFT_890926 [Fibularhizoctonia sp. CBS 109695]
MQPPVNVSKPYITLSEAKRYISRISPDPPDGYFQHVLLGWMKFLAPLTLSNVNNIPHLQFTREAAKPLDNISGSTVTLLREVAKAGGRQLSEAKSFSLLSKAWPTMWIWIQHIYYDHLQTLNHWMDAVAADIFTRRYMLLKALFDVFVDYIRKRKKGRSFGLRYESLQAAITEHSSPSRPS